MSSKRTMIVLRRVTPAPISPASHQLLQRVRQRQAWRSALLMTGLLGFVLATTLSLSVHVTHKRHTQSSTMVDHADDIATQIETAMWEVGLTATEEYQRMLSVGETGGRKTDETDDRKKKDTNLRRRNSIQKLQVKNTSIPSVTNTTASNSTSAGISLEGMVQE